MPQGRPDAKGYYDDSVTGATFLFEVDGEVIGWFQEVGGLEVEVAVEEIEEGGQNGFKHKLPGKMSWPNITLKRGLLESDNLFKWVGKASGEGFAGEKNKLERTSAAITLVSAAGERLRAWEIDGAFAVKWKGPQFSVSSTEVPSEELEIAHHGFRSRKL